MRVYLRLSGHPRSLFYPCTAQASCIKCQKKAYLNESKELQDEQNY